MERPSEQLVDLAFFALDHGVKSVIGSDGPMTPFAIIEDVNGQRTLARFMTGQSPAEAHQHARAHVARAVDCVKYAVVADGWVTEQNTRIPVILVEVGRRGEQHGYSFIQRFCSTAETKYGQVVRNPSIIDHPSVISPASET